MSQQTSGDFSAEGVDDLSKHVKSDCERGKTQNVKKFPLSNGIFLPHQESSAIHPWQTQAALNEPKEPCTRYCTENNAVTSTHERTPEILSSRMTPIDTSFSKLKVTACETVLGVT